MIDEPRVAGAGKGTPEQPKSKTKELRDWLDAEIGKISGDTTLLSSALGINHNPFNPGAPNRYRYLTSGEREAKMAGDRWQLEELKKRLELLRSARELDVDVDALERMGFSVEFRYGVPKVYDQVDTVSSRPIAINADLSRALTGERVRIILYASERIVSITVNGHSVYELEGVTCFEVQRSTFFSTLWCWFASSIKDKEHALSIVVCHEPSPVIGVRLATRFKAVVSSN